MRKHYIILLIFVLFLIFSCSNEYVFSEKDNTVETVSDDSLRNYLDGDYGTEKALREKFIKLAAVRNYKRSEKDTTEEISSFISALKNNETVSKDSDTYTITKAESMNIPFDDTSSVISKDVITISDEENVCLNIYDTVNSKTDESFYVIIPNDRRFGDVIFMSDSGKWEDVKDLEITQSLIQDIIDTIKYKMEIWNSITEEEIEYASNQLNVSKAITITSSHAKRETTKKFGSDTILNTINYDQQGEWNDVLEVVYGNDYPLGCHPTGVAMLCTYFGWPEKFIEYTENGRKATLANVKKAFPEHADWDGTYDWNAIRKGEKNYQVAALIFDIAEIDGTRYAGGGSPTTVKYKGETYLDLVGYKYDLFWGNACNNIDAAKNVINSLENNRPALATGAHTFILDGAKIIEIADCYYVFSVDRDMSAKPFKTSLTSTNIYYHCNLGWGGYLNGWYAPDHVTDHPDDIKVDYVYSNARIE